MAIDFEESPNSRLIR